ncbi:hypothetical protein GQ43DRAFT_373221 [Delitschia confertaspora ATCC 74209]|uniref:Uncharacterized protein n=1 Tax=Delitschia confertaspora ATCC 74209 TaxID=1513339 RepID=A0A9P4JJU3_9PLEO|nr:hypothetical protein GQ43DRAFT_373221 [Delitschia confertaspora ATCC 74209]
MACLVVAICLLFSFIVSYCDASPLASPASRPLVSRAIPTTWSLPHRVQLGGNTPNSFVQRNEVEEKRANQQIPIQWCPEFYGNPPKLCSQCGGDSRIKGTCDRILLSGQQRWCPPRGPYDQCTGYYCKCSDNGGPDNSPKVTMTTVIDGKTGTAIWEPLTMTEYKKLRASTTITLAETATLTGDSQVETVVAVVFAGGIAWWLACKPQDSKEDDKSCKKPKEDCAQCGGANKLDLCSSGPKEGCPCEEKQECPKDGPPACTSPACGGDDGNAKCKAKGKTKGCNCCPARLDKEGTCFDDECMGDKDQKCTTEGLKGCKCNPFAGSFDPIFDPSFPDVPNDREMKDVASKIIKNVYKGDYDKVPGVPKVQKGPWCVYG